MIAVDNTVNDETKIELENHLIVSPVSTTPSFEQLNNFQTSSPINLANFDEPDTQNLVDNLAVIDSFDFSLYEGSKVSHDEFLKKFDRINDKHRLSEVAKTDILKLIATVLPHPNQVFADIPLFDLPIVTTCMGNSKMLFADLISQIHRIVCRNEFLINPGQMYVAGTLKVICFARESFHWFSIPMVLLSLNLISYLCGPCGFKSIIFLQF